jgi:hypothetical protein
MDSNIINISDFGESSNFGSGIELLMNDKKYEAKGNSSDINIDELDNLERELNNLASDSLPNNYESNLFGVKSSLSDDKPFAVSFDEQPDIRILDDNVGLGQSTANTSSNSKTWDGYGKFDNIPMNPDINVSSEPKLSKDDLLREKFKYLRKLESLEKKGVELTKKYSMDSNLQEMIGEYEMIMEEKQKLNSVKFQGNMMMAIINGIEFLNNRFDPFDIKLDGWGEQITENINDYDDVFAELYEKYKSKATMAPELKLLFQLGGSALMVHMSNTMFKSAMPGMDDILRQNPDLMRQFQNAAVSSMATSNPGFSGFMGGLMNDNRNAPPSPVATKGPNAVPPPLNRGGNNVRHDISAARGFTDGINIQEKYSINAPQPAQKSNRRPDMKGPSDIEDILSGLKTKTISIAKAETVEDINNNSTISIDDLRSIQGEGNAPKRSRRKNKSDRNTVSVDL